MAKRLRAYLALMEKMKDKEMTEEEREEFLKQMLVQIQFFQHNFTTLFNSCNPKEIC